MLEFTRFISTALLIVIYGSFSVSFAKTLPVTLNSFNIYTKSHQFDSMKSNSKADSRQTDILFPLPETPAPASTSFLPNLGFLSDLSLLALPDNPASGVVRIGRDVLESEQCVEKVSCMVTKVTGKYSYLSWIHNFLTDLPFEGDLADRLKTGVMTSTKESSDPQCTYRCHPTNTIGRAFKMMRLLNEIISINRI